MRTNLRVASWNILNDWAVPKHPSQSDRLESIASEIKRVYNQDEKFVLFLCEVSSLETIDYICKEVGLVIAGEPINYRSNLQEFSVFLVDPKTAKKSRTKAIKVLKEPRNKILQIKIGNLKIIGCHSPWRLIRHTRSKNKHMTTILHNNPDIFMGDFNATPIFWTRIRASRLYKESHQSIRPPFPSKYYRGKNIHWWIPTINIDAIFHRPKFKSSNAKFSLNNSSDHPLIWTDITVQ